MPIVVIVQLLSIPLSNRVSKPTITSSRCSVSPSVMPLTYGGVRGKTMIRTSALMQWGSLCQSEKGLAYKEKAQDAKSNAISVLTCADTDSLSSAFDTGYYCASHSYGYWRSEEVFETTIMDICVGLLAPTNKYAECQLTAKRLYRQMVEEKGGHQSL